MMIAIATYIVVSAFVFRFQRTTLGIARLLDTEKVASVQVLLTPGWIGALGWLSKILFLIGLVLAFREHGWFAALALIAYSLFGVAVLDRISPLPTYSQCFALAKGSLRGLKAGKSLLERMQVDMRLQRIEEIEDEYLNSASNEEQAREGSDTNSDTKGQRDGWPFL